MKKGWSSENVETFFYEQRNDFINKRMIFLTFKIFFVEIRCLELKNFPLPCDNIYI